MQRALNCGQELNVLKAIKKHVRVFPEYNDTLVAGQHCLMVLMIRSVGGLLGKECT